MQTISIPTEDTMPLNDADRAWIREAIGSAHKRAGLGKLTGFIKDWGGAGAAVAILIFAFSRWEGYVEFRTSTNIRLDRIEKTLGTINDNLAEQSLLNHTVLPLSDFKATLSDLNSAIIRAKQQNVKVSSAIINDLQGKLRESADAPSFWPTAAEFISYRSQVNAIDFQTLSRPDMPDCTDHPPTPMEYRMTSEEEHSTKEETNRIGLDSSRFTPAIYENCRFVLDSPEEAERFPLLGKSFNLEFKNCQIIYNGGPIAILTPNPRFSAFNGKGPTRSDLFIMKGQALRFENCLFLFTIKVVPPKEGQQMTHELLAQSGAALSYGHIRMGGE
jgi:hypothetical protein